jgi:16S rRNA (uracil1498-N3)-methyltransferase
MELFYSTQMENGLCTLTEEESRHCAKVLRHNVGDTINVIDGCGSLLECRIIECGKKVVCSVERVQENFGTHNYHLTMAVCPTKNIDRYEWFLEKATEMGIDEVVPVIGEHSERRIIKPERLEKILVSAAKQSLKGAIPVLRDAVSVKQFIKECAAAEGVKLIAYCGEQEKVTLAQAVQKAVAANPGAPRITILIGPEGDFSPAEVEAAIGAGFSPLTLGDSRLRTETAAVAAVAGVYFMVPSIL